MAYLNVDDLRDEYRDLREAEERGEDDEERLDYLAALFDALGSDKPDVLIPEKDFVRVICDEAEQQVPDMFRSYIDWDTYISDVRADYVEIDVDGDTFLYLA